MKELMNIGRGRLTRLILDSRQNRRQEKMGHEDGLGNRSLRKWEPYRTPEEYGMQRAKDNCSHFPGGSLICLEHF